MPELRIEPLIPSSDGAAWPRRVVNRLSGAVPLACVLLAVTVIAYLPALDAGFVFDDSVYLTEDARMGTVGGLARIWTEVGGPQYQHQYYPLTSTAFWVQQSLWGSNPVGYHLVNVLLHAANAILLWRLLRRLGVPGAWIAATIFAVHPVNVQSVAWISELKNVLSTFFFLASAHLFVGFLALDAAGAGADRPLSGRDSQRWKTYAIGLVLFGCALASKTATCLLPVALGLILYWKRDRIRGRDLAALAPLVVIGLAFVSLTVYLESHYKAGGEAFSQSFIERVLIAGRAVSFYAGKLVWPSDLTIVYPRWDVDASVWWQYLYPLGVALVVAVLWVARRRIGKGPLVAVVYFIVAVAPLSFVNVAFTRLSYVADHWQYWASMALVSLAVAVVVRSAGGIMVVLGAMEAGVARSRAGARYGAQLAAAAIVVAILSGLTWRRAAVFESPRTLWSDAVKKNPHAWQTQYNLGVALADEGRFDEAVHSFRQALQIDPTVAKVHNNLGFALRSQGRLEESFRQYQEAVRLVPRFAKAHNNLGEVLHTRGLFEEAIAHYLEAIRLDSSFAGAHYNLGVAYRSREQLDKAVDQYRRALAITPDAPEVHGNLGEVFARLGRHDEAIESLQNAIRLDGESAAAHYNLAMVLRSKGDLPGAIRHFRQTARIAPDSAEVHNSLGEALQASGELKQAISHFRRALDLEPAHAAASDNLQLALSTAPG
ncbi:MAG: tetratricopeptide repeat protein [Planctomycetes bacterium]|nr:tetratricopeptide repeat protein [Planctomycetota bacterium]